jgi:predicted NAD-dependent protein-ADP-ribosyltransferase YbiA (DUF1768 family)
MIRFYSVTAEYGELFNFAPYPIKLRGKRWPTSEHFFQRRSSRTLATKNRSAPRARP